jgi:hypothetical protein
MQKRAPAWKHDCSSETVVDDGESKASARKQYVTFLRDEGPEARLFYSRTTVAWH